MFENDCITWLGVCVLNSLSFHMVSYLLPDLTFHLLSYSLPVCGPIQAVASDWMLTELGVKRSWL